MAEVQWIRLMVGMFDGDSFKRIKRAQIGGVPFRDKLTAVWFELLDLAGKSNANGYLINSNEIPYRSFEDIATMLDRDEKEIELCMQYFVSEQMVEIIDDIYCLTNFIRYQNQDGLAKIREQNRLRQKKWYDKKKALEAPNEKPNVRLTLSNALEIDKEIDTDKDIIKEIHKEKKPNAKAFVPPTYDEVLSYAKEKGREDIAKEFFEYFNVGNWIDSKGNKVKNWKQKFITWCSRNKASETKQSKQCNLDAKAVFARALERTYGKGE
jgi:predicted phage replisome organizer